MELPLKASAGLQYQLLLVQVSPTAPGRPARRQRGHEALQGNLSSGPIAALLTGVTISRSFDSLFLFSSSIKQRK